ncbi:MAG: GGDEF domain-containing protein, partial [Actinobacteria bacterium]|nr:GGDEF domain-containing protein [Actinomycetota bacterium]
HWFMELSNIFTLLSILTLFFSLLAGIYGLAISFFRKSSISFFMLSMTTAVISLATILILNIKDYSAALPPAYILTGGIFIFPAVTFHFLTNMLKISIFKKNKYLRIMLYVPPAAIILYFIFGKQVFMVPTKFGYLSNLYGYTNFGFFFLLPCWLAVLFIISLKIYKNRKQYKSNLPAATMLTGVSLYFMGNGIYHSLSASGLAERIPANSILLFIFYFFVTVSVIMLEFNIESITLRNIFEHVDDCIIIANNEGAIKEINRSMHKLLYGNSESFNSKKIDPEKIKSDLLEKITSKNSAELFFSNLKGNGRPTGLNYTIKFSLPERVRVFDVSLSPIIDKNRKIYGKLAIFRDVTEYRILQEKLKEQAEIDFLTNIFNRRYFHNRLNQEIKRFHRNGQPLCLLVIDIDNFKKYNDKHGHLKGDWLLKEVAGIIKRNIREDIDVAARFGGDEFAVILINTDTEKAKEIASRIVNDYEDNIKNSDTSLSIGVALYRENMEMDDLIKKTDLLMYRYKKLDSTSKRTWLESGRRRVSVMN